MRESVDYTPDNRSWHDDRGTFERCPLARLISLDRVSIAFGHLPLLDEAALQVEPRERVAVIGRNGTGKSTLLKIIGGELPPDAGTIWRQPGLRIARLEQDVPLSANRSVFDVVAEGHTHRAGKTRPG